MAFFKDSLDALNDAQNFLNQNNPLTTDQKQQFGTDGFLLPSTYSADGNGLPYTKVPRNKPAQLKRNIITWFIPEFGLIRMYVNPESITYTDSKLINPDLTKGGYTLQYWGEQLTKIKITGTTGSSGYEGINALHEMYRAEQYANDGLALSLAASNSVNDLATKGLDALGGMVGQSLFGGVAGAAGGAIGAGILGGLMGVDSSNAGALASKNMTTMAEMAFTVEMFYNGFVYRGFFQDMVVTERADNFLLNYDISFVATQRRGYRLNNFVWSKSANDGPSEDGDNLGLLALNYNGN